MCRTVLTIARGVIGLLVTFFCSLIAAAEAEGPIAPPDIPFPESTVISTLSSPPVTRINLGGLGVELEKTELKEVIKKAGIGTVQRRGNAGDSEYWVCFTLPSTVSAQRLWLASGEMGGQEHSIYLVYAEARSGKYEKSGFCPELPDEMKPISINKSIWLGSTTAELTKAFGRPSRVNGSWWEFSYEGRVSYENRKNKVDHFYDLSDFLVVKVINGKVVTLFASKISSD